MEYRLIKKAKEVNQSILDNNNEPTQPNISEAECAELETFLVEIYQTLPLVDIKAFEVSELGLVKKDNKHTPSLNQRKRVEDSLDTVVVPAQEENFQNTFIAEKSWYGIRISRAMLSRIKYIAAYRVGSVSAITHWAEIERIEPYGNEGKYKLIFKKQAQELQPSVENKHPRVLIQSRRYTNFQKLRQSKYVADLWGDAPE